MSRGPIHAARPGLAGNHRTDGLVRCPCDPYQMLDLNEPDRVVVVHRPMRDDVQHTPTTTTTSASRATS